MNPLHLNPTEVLQRLAARRAPRPELDTPFVAPADEIEEAIAGCWAEVLGLREVGAQDNFFSLGGDSLHMTRIAARVHERCGAELPIERFFSDPTVAGLAGAIRNEQMPDAGDGASFADQTADVGLERIAPAITETVARDESFTKRREFSNTNEATPAITSVVIATAGRPRALQRCLTALDEVFRRSGRAPRVLVLDGSADDAQRAAACELIARPPREQAAGKVELIDLAAMRAFTQRLVAAGFDPDLVEFALPGVDRFRAGSRLGASRNALLLATAGECFLSIDDDTDCASAGVASEHQNAAPASDRVELDQAGDDPAEVWVHPDRESLLAAYPLRSIDLLGCHEQLLGRSASNGSVRVTLNGLVGDCAWGTPSRYLFLDDASFTRLTQSDAGYRQSTTSREMLRTSPAWRISGRVENLIAAAFGADARSWLPPFVPVGRGSDVVFGRLLKQVEPSALFGHVPWAILHLPVEGRRFSPGEILRSGATTDLRAMFCGLIARAGGNSPQRTGLDALRSIGESLGGIAALAAPQFLEVLQDIKAAQADEEIAFLERRLARVPANVPSCRRDLEAYLRALSRTRTEPTAAIPAELQYGRPLTEAAENARTITALYGRLLRAWPDLLHTAAAAKRDGRFLSF